MAENYYARMVLYRERMKDMIKRVALSTWVSVERMIGEGYAYVWNKGRRYLGGNKGAI